MTPQQRAVFGFSRCPFTVHTNDTPWFDDTRQAHFQRLRQFADRGGFALVHGCPGSGKTRFCTHLLQTCNTNTHQGIHMPYATLNESGILQNLAWKLGVEPSNSRPRNLQRIANHLKNAPIPILIFDELQHACAATIQTIRLLCEENTLNHRKIPVILVGTDALVGLLGMNICESMRQRITLCIHIKPLTPEQVSDYILYHFKLANVEHPILDPAAATLIAETTGGIPRLIEHLTLAALQTAADQNHQTLTIDHVHQAADITFIPKTERQIQ